MGNIMKNGVSYSGGGGGGDSTPHVSLTKAEYDALVQAGTVDEDTVYMITDDTGASDTVYSKSQVDALLGDKADKDDLASISITGTANNTGATIASGTYFYLNGALVQAKTDILDGATLTMNTNYIVVTAGGLNALNDYVTANKDGTEINIASYNSAGNAYVCPYDGYVQVGAKGTSGVAKVTILGTNGAQFATHSTSVVVGDSSRYNANLVFVRKGMKVYVADATAQSTIFMFEPILQ